MDPRNPQGCSPTAQDPGPDVTLMTRRKLSVKIREERKRQRQEEHVKYLGWGVWSEEEVVRESNREASEQRAGTQACFGHCCHQFAHLEK